MSLSSLLSIPSLGLALLAGISLGCSDSKLDPGQRGPLEELLACARDGAGEVPSYTACDIVESDCQQRIAEIAACQWGGPEAAVVWPVVSTLSQQEYRQRLSASSAGDEQARALRAAVDTSLALFGLIDGGDLSLEAVAERNAEGVLAYYDPASASITVIEQSGGTSRAEANATLLHEMIHALQDATYDLDELRRESTNGSSDGALALRSLVEGEAKFHDLLFSASASGRPLTAQLLQEQLRQRRALSEDVLFQGHGVLASSLQSVPYLYGPEWILERWLAGGGQAVQAAYRDVPADLLGLLQSSWGEAQATAEPSHYPAPNVYTTGAEPEAGSELIPLAYDRLGAYTVYAAARLAGDAAAGRQLALSWRGDQLDVYELDRGGPAARWHVTFDGAGPAATFAGLLARSGNVSVRSEGSDVVGVVSQSGDTPEWLFGPLGR